MIDVDFLKTCMKNVLSDTRYLHSMGVYEVAIDMAHIYGCDVEKTGVAAILHDCAKPLSDNVLLMECNSRGIPVSQYEAKNLQLLHAKIGAVIAKEEYGVEDMDILNAITYHTTGRPGMSILEKIIFIADYIEPNRKELPRIKEIRKAAYTNIDYAIVMILENTLTYLQSTDTCIDIMTVRTCEYYQASLLF